MRAAPCFIAAVVVAVSLAPGEARAEPSRFHLDADLTTDFPVAIGGRVGLELPYRLRLSTSLGYLPSPYVEAINGFLVAIKAFDDATSALVKSALKSSLVWRTHVGIRPFARHGFVIDAGYGLVTLGGSATASELLAATTGQAPPEGDPGSSRNFSLGSTLHMLDVEFGWEWLILERLHLRAALGGAFTVGSSTSIEPDYRPRAPQATKIYTTASEAYLDNIYTSYVFTPVISVGVGYRFF